LLVRWIRGASILKVFKGYRIGNLTMPVVWKKRRVLFFAKLIVSLGLVAYLVWIVDWERAVETINQINKLLITICPVLSLIGLVSGTVRWRFVLADSNVAFSCPRAYIGYLVGSFYGIFLPGVIGGDAVRIGFCVSQTKCKIGTATASVLVERIAGVFALLSFLLSVHLLFPTSLSSLVTLESTAPVAVAATVGIIVIVAVVLGRRVWVKWLPGANTRRVWGFVHSGIEVLSALRGKTTGVVLVLSALFQATDIVVAFLLSQAIGLAVPLPVFFAIIPLVYLATVLPISLGGLGVREGTLVFLLSKFGVATSDAVTLSFLIYLNRVVVGGIGGLMQLIRTISSRKPVA